VQHPVPVIIGGKGPKRTPDLVARFANEYNLGFPEDHEIAPRIATVRAACERIGRDPATLKLSLAMSTFAGRDDADVARRAAATGHTLEQVRDGVNIVGDAAEIAERIDVYRSQGIERVYFQLLDLQDVGHVEYLGEVLPGLPR